MSPIPPWPTRQRICQRTSSRSAHLAGSTLSKQVAGRACSTGWRLCRYLYETNEHHMTSLRKHQFTNSLSYTASFQSPDFDCLLCAKTKARAQELLSHELHQCLQMGGGTPDWTNNFETFFLQRQSKNMCAKSVNKKNIHAQNWKTNNEVWQSVR